jgi:monoamine oxidase
LNASMESWYGLGLQELSALSLIDFFVIPYPGGDERYHVLGGNDLVPRRLANRLGDIVRLERPLEAIVRRPGGDMELTFGGRHLPVHADLVVLALPYTVLREVDLSRARLRDDTMRAIAHLGMGTNAKVLLQYTSRFHEMTTVNGAPFSSVLLRDDPTLGTWESSTNQDGASGLLTVYAGGRTGSMLWASAQPHAPGEQPLVGDTVAQVDEVVPGSADRFNGTAWVDWWTGDPWVRGSYAAYLPGQVTRYWHNVGPADGTVHFAGEHTSTYSQGFLNGGVESGNRAAIEIMHRLGLPVPRRIARLPYSTFSSRRILCAGDGTDVGRCGDRKRAGNADEHPHERLRCGHLVVRVPPRGAAVRGGGGPRAAARLVPAGGSPCG